MSRTRRMAAPPVLTLVLGAALALGLGLAAGTAAAQDMDALARDGIGLPMKPADAAAGPWALSTAGRTICEIRLGAARGPSGVYPAQIPAACGAVLPPGLVGWKPVTDGLALVGADGRSVVDFNQWTPRDLSAPRRGAPHLELSRVKPPT